MARMTFVEDLSVRTDPYTGPCQWTGCEREAVMAVGQWDTKTQNEDQATFRYMCQPHAVLIEEMVEEVE